MGFVFVFSPPVCSFEFFLSPVCPSVSVCSRGFLLSLQSVHPAAYCVGFSCALILSICSPGFLLSLVLPVVCRRGFFLCSYPEYLQPWVSLISCTSGCLQKWGFLVVMVCLQSQLICVISCVSSQCFRTQELCESRGGRPGLYSLISLQFLWT